MMLFLLFLSCCVLSAQCQSSSNGTVLWGGFSFTWLRRVAGFRTPHRLGSFSNAVVGIQGAHNAVLNLTLTPGVDGDFAYPASVLTAVADSQATFQLEEYSITTTDQVTGPASDPQALTSHTWPAQRVLKQQCVRVLRGVRVDMHCDASKQPEGHSCNSNGAWPYLLRAASTATQIDFQLGRAWTPMRGGGKPMTQRLDLNITVYCTVVCEAPYKSLAQVDVYSDMRADLRANVSNVVPAGVVVPSEFGFQLLKTKNNDRLGRYIEGITLLSPGDATTLSGISAPATVVNSKSHLWSKLVSFAPFERESKKTVQGQVCFSGFMFNCKRKGLIERTNHAVPVKF